jgi:hypothetical protein
MAKTSPRSGKQWTGSEETKLDEYRKQNMPTRVIAWKLGRSVESIYSKSSEDGKTLSPRISSHTTGGKDNVLSKRALRLAS